MMNKELATLFYEIADILEIRKVEWKPRAYRKAAIGIENLEVDVSEIYKKEGIRGLKDISGVGESIANKIIEYIETGKIEEFDKLKKHIPSSLIKLMEVSSLGPKKLEVLFKKLKIKSDKDLEKACKEHKIAKLPGFGPVSERNILEGLELFRRRKARNLLGGALPVAEGIVSELKKLKEVKKISLAGSLRRMRETIGDLDILVVSSNPKKVMDYFCDMKDVSKVLAKGSTKSMVLLKNDMQADLRVLDPKAFGAGLQYFTGSKDHNVKLRQIAISKGYKLSEYGLFSRRSDKFVAGKTEEEIYKKLDMQYIEPELRENSGEIKAALARKLPKLIKHNDVKGDLQMHTTHSDGSDSIEEMAKAAKKLRYEYIAITDHSKSQKIAGGMSTEQFKKYIKDVERANKKIKGIRILKGSEVDILKDGSLDYDDKLLKKLDIVLAAVHSGFRSSEKEMTKRICSALENKYIDILAHPTGRLINRRNPYKVNLKKLFEAAKENNVALEINAFPTRLDLNAINARAAVEAGVKLTIGTDAHSTDQLKVMRYGVSTARRGWVKKRDVLNTRSLKDLSGFFKKI